MSATPTPPPVSELITHGYEVAAVLSLLTSQPEPRGQALAELDAAEKLNKDGRTNPAAFAHTIMDYYLNVAGDFVHGLSTVLNPTTRLAFSPPVLARAACEHANACWWLANPTADLAGRIGRTVTILHQAIDQQMGQMDASTIMGLRQLEELLRSAATEVADGAVRLKFPTSSQLFIDMVGDGGRGDYAWLSRQAHGNLFEIMRGYQAATQSEPDLLWRVWHVMLLASRHALMAATRVHDLRGLEMSELRRVVDRHEIFAKTWEEWLGSGHAPIPEEQGHVGLTEVPDVGASRRLLGMLQALLAERVGAQLPPPPPQARDIVTEVDALEAIVQAAAVLDQTLQEGGVDPERLIFASACLMVVRERIRTLPQVASDRGEDAVAGDLRELVGAIRAAQDAFR